MQQLVMRPGEAGLEIVLPGEIRAVLHRECCAAGEILRIEVPYTGAYGMGEKFNGLNQKGKYVVNQVIEHFCHQGNDTYLPAPFFVTDTGLGIYIDTDKRTAFRFEETIVCELPREADVYVFAGNVDEVISSYMKRLGEAKLPPKYAFGVWISANHWNCQRDVEQQLRYLEKYQFPASVMVLEAWSDEATFYIWNGAAYRPKPEGDSFRQDEFDYSQSAYWKDPAGMIQSLHEKGIRLVLWQIPVYKGQPREETPNEQLVLDTQDAVSRDLCVKYADGSPYRIPEGNWFEHSLIPDFSNPKTCASWFEKRQYLLDMGVDGFKTDGGEFIYREDIKLYNGMDGTEAKNAYARLYTKAYTDFIGTERVLFSRAGSRGAHQMPIHWAGDQQSENNELKSVFYAGMSAAMTGIPFWSFDIGGFAGPLPTADLYRRATQLACFVPVMQWHSEPDGGQFKELMPGADGNNERSPWNIARAWGQPELLEEIRFWHNLHMDLVPYIYSTAIDCCENCRPVMRPLVYTWPQEEQAVRWEDEYLFGDSLLVAPLLEENQTQRELWLPEGKWYGFFSHEEYSGGACIESNERFPVYIRGGYAVALRRRRDAGFESDVEVRRDVGFGKGTGLGRDAGFEKDSAAAEQKSDELHFLLAGEEGTCRFRDENTELQIRWKNGKAEVEEMKDRNRNITWEILS
ncbi:MAG: glycoside hydrolase family 31 protein [Lachnospiraceae bacterium]|nr:glycoside hydrolase family 31 protein [Lachnospiraceae bacterium]